MFYYTYLGLISIKSGSFKISINDKAAPSNRNDAKSQYNYRRQFKLNKTNNPNNVLKNTT